MALKIISYKNLVHPHPNVRLTYVQPQEEDFGTLKGVVNGTSETHKKTLKAHARGKKKYWQKHTDMQEQKQ